MLSSGVILEAKGTFFEFSFFCSRNKVKSRLNETLTTTAGLRKPAVEFEADEPIIDSKKKKQRKNIIKCLVKRKYGSQKVSSESVIK